MTAAREAPISKPTADADFDAGAAERVIVRATDHIGIVLANWLQPTRSLGGKAPEKSAKGPVAVGEGLL